MFPTERRERIARMIETEGSVKVDDLASLFSVSVDSIRKDLKALCDQGLCRREYGGAVRVDRDAAEPLLAVPEPPSVSPALAAEQAARDLVAALAYEQIRDNDAVFLDVSETSRALAHLIAAGDKRAIVTTNMEGVPRVLAANPKVSALMTGGHLSADGRGYVGPSAVNVLDSLAFDKAFIGTSSVSLETGAVMSDVMDDGLVKQRAMDHAAETYLLAEGFKFSRGAGYRFASLGDFGWVVTTPTDERTLERLRAYGVPVLA